MKILQGVNLSNCIKDRAWWKLNNDGLYSAKSFSKGCWMQNQSIHMMKGVWKGAAPPRAELLVWFILQERLNTRSILSRFNLIRDTDINCPFCNNEEETISHLFLHCMLSWNIWMEVLKWWNVQLPITQTPKQWFECWMGAKDGSFQRNLWISFAM